MKPELKAKILAYNRTIAEKNKKAEDLDILVNALLNLPYGQLKKVMTVDVQKVLRKYGYIEE